MRVFNRIAKNARLGDGYVGIGTNNVNAKAQFYTTNQEMLFHKRRMCEEDGIVVGNIGTQKSGYGGTKTIYNFYVRVDERFTKVVNSPLIDIIKDLTEEDIFLWYLDDGSWHKTTNTMHLYSNGLNKEESEVLIEVISNLYGVKPIIRIDRKRDGREFFYLYFPRDLVRIIRPKIKQYILNNSLDSLLYKVGGKEYEDKDSVVASENEVREIRRLREVEGKTLSEISEIVGMSISRISRISNYETYKNIV